MSNTHGNSEALMHARNNANANDLHSSNRTCGHFLGVVPRGWMSGETSGNTLSPMISTPIRPHPEGSFVMEAASYSSTSAATQNRSVNEDASLNTALLTNSIASPLSRVPPHIGVNTSLDYWDGRRVSSINENATSSNSTNMQYALVPSVLPMTHNVDRTNHLLPPNSSALVPGLQTEPSALSPTLPQTASSEINHLNNVPTRRHTVSTMAICGNRLSVTENTSYSGNSQDARASPRSSYTVPPITSNGLSSGAQPLHEATSPGNARLSHGQVAHVATFVPSAMPSHPSQNQQVNLSQTLEQKLAAVTAKRRLTSPEMVRVTWLRGACELGDTMFLLLHQLTCINTVYPQFLLTKMAFLQCHVQSLHLFGHILGDNRHIYLDVMAIFCNYIRPLSTLTAVNPDQNWIVRAKDFLARFTVRWESLRVRVFERGCPPSADEIAQELSVEEPVVSQALFTNFFYQLFPNSSNVFMEASFELFRANQSIRHKQRNEGRQLNRSAQDLQGFVTSIKMLAARHQQRALTTFQPLTSIMYDRPQLVGRVSSSQSSIPPHQVLSSNTQPIASRPSAMRIQSGPIANSSNTASAWAPTVATNPLQTRADQSALLFPQPGRLLPITVGPNPNRIALHQAHLSQPHLLIEGLQENVSDAVRMYLFSESLIGKPQHFDGTTVFETWSFTVSPDILKRLAQDVAVPSDNPFGKSSRRVRNGLIMFHCRCIKVSATHQPLDIDLCSAAATHWPEHLFISINGTHLEFRRKSHHGKDLPIDITPFIQQEENEMKLSYHATKNEDMDRFVIIVEAVNVLNHAAVRQLPSSVGAQTSLAAITDSMKNNMDDDDLVMADAHVSIDLIDPFTAQIFDLPTKGRTCRHRECFDLESFLRSRSCRNKDNFIQPDEWRCPMCGKDARPSSLVIDQFLLQVKEKLLADGQTDVRAILVKEDGSWTPKAHATGNATSSRNATPAVAQGRRSASTTTEIDGQNGRQGPNHPSAVAEFILLEDDE